MFCNLTYSCIQFIQRMVPPLSIIYKTKLKWFSLLYKKSRQLSTQELIIFFYRHPLCNITIRGNQ